MTEDRLVVLLDDAGRPMGTMPRDAVHGTDTPLHLAFSCYLLGPDGRVLITRRALTKLTWPGVWTNSFCGHPQPEEPMEAAVRRHAVDELGVTLDTLTSVLPTFRYRATDASGVVENEVCPVFVATTSDAVVANPLEVAEWAWVGMSELAEVARATPQLLSPWSVLQLQRLSEAMAVHT
ncbi:isopentenyl-diphosphate Delta-isomerase [Demequina sp.]|uniref:isopentenyl-diphosphate Delta-isomerase n=1 Tax=Demequina sp. TaxID=2050685 RepID=UPI003D102888